MKAAAVDIGTNSCRLLVAEAKSDNSFVILNRSVEITRLGEGVDENRVLKKSAVKRVLETLKKYISIIEKHKVDKLRIVGTSALRDVKNPEILAEKIRSLGYELEIISGKKEAELNYLGAVSNLDSNFLLLDIGGGSTEFIWPEDSKINFKSIDIGCVRMTEKFISAPEKALSLIEKENIDKQVKKLLKKELTIKDNFKVKGVGGTITTLASIKLGMTEYDSKKIENLQVDMSELKKILNNLAHLSLEKRKKIRGLQPERADIIIAGLIILKSILEFIGSEFIYVSDHDLLYGILKSELSN